MTSKDQELVNKVVEKIMKEFDFEIEDLLEAEKEKVEQAIKDFLMESLEEDGPCVDWISLVDLGEAEQHRNERGEFLAN
ncbi:MAG: hypothetical protein HY520_02955 [Candidatus Aenigmarchaeota archaeon]|nr:hypothetical protein [Candidatus Aenigmarchaeota archaeon]